MPLTAAAQYLRASTESQQYSLHNQASAIADYAKAHGFKIVQTYSDKARSGLILRHRQGLRDLLSDIVVGKHEYSVILAYDISRWGRFQDTDEAAHYEFLCKSAGVALHYCAEPFDNDGTLASSLLKTLKRGMAAEFSRELGVKVYQGKRARAAAGFSVGGRTPYGFRRQIVSEDPRRSRVLEAGERKNVRIEKLTLVHGASHEVDCVREIFRKVSQDHLTARAIGQELNSRGITLRGRRWTKDLVHYVLTNPVYAGFSAWGRTSQRLGSTRIRLSTDQWVLKPDSFPPIIGRAEFEVVQTLLQPESGRVFWTRERALQAAKQLLTEKKELTYRLFDETPGFPSTTTLHRLGFAEICDCVGFKLPRRFVTAANGIKNTFRLHQEVIESFANRFPDDISISPGRWPRLLVDKQIVVSLLICRGIDQVRGKRRWRICPVPRDSANVTVVCRLDIANTAPHSFFVFPRIDLKGRHEFGDGDSWLESGQYLEDASHLCALLRAAALSKQH